MKRFIVFLCCLAICFGLGLNALAGVGVGIGIGKIRVEEILKPGGIYQLASIPVINTGDVVGNYELGIEYHRDQTQMRPPAEWFRFNPEKFTLNPNQSQIVEIILTLPIKQAKPGDYFAFIEARPIIEKQEGTSISIAAATQLWFTASSANAWQALYYRISYKMKKFWDFATPWIWIVVAVILLILIIFFVKKFFKVELKRK